MRRRKLQQIADELCLKFCEGDVIQRYPKLLDFGSGVLRFDLLNSIDTFQEQPVDELGIADELSAWFKVELISNSLSVSDIVSAQLLVEMSFSTAPFESQLVDSDSTPATTHTFHRCVVRCKSEIVTDENVYRGILYDVKEWPMKWSLAS
jgi:hypothetical protein